MIDTHCHLSKDDYNDIVANIMNRINTIIKPMIEIEVDNI